VPAVCAWYLAHQPAARAAQGGSPRAVDAGIDPSEINGFVSYGGDDNEPVKLTHDLATRDVRWSSAVWRGGGGGTCAAVEHAALAIANGQAEAVVVFRALVQRDSGRVSEAVAANHFNPHHLMAGLTTPAQSGTGFHPWRGYVDRRRAPIAGRFGQSRAGRAKVARDQRLPVADHQFADPQQ
jgi:hypothetical protein